MTENGWHLKREVTVGQIVTTIVVAASLGMWMLDVEGKADKNADTIEITRAELLTAISARKEVVDLQLDAQRASVTVLNEQLGQVVNALQEQTRATTVNSERLNGIITRMDERRRQ